MKYVLLALAAASSALARNFGRQGNFTFDPTTIRTTIATTRTVYNPASAPSAGTATVTNSANATRTRTSEITKAPESTCCYLWPEGVGINTWWSSTANVTVATVITTWLKYNNTIVAANSTTVTVTNATAMFGTYGLQYLTTSSPTRTYTTTSVHCSGIWSGGSCSGMWTETTTMHDYTSYPITDPLILDVPNTLLPTAAVLYGSTIVQGFTAATFTDQDLTIASPTPFYSYQFIHLYTDFECPTEQTYTSLTTKIRTTVDGTPSYNTEYYPLYTTTPLPNIYPMFNSGPNTFLNVTVFRPFPDGDYSDWNFTTWMDGSVTGAPAGPVDAYTFWLEDDLAEWFASNDAVREAYPDIGKCTPLVGGGEPTVHVPVQQLTDTKHVTMTMGAALTTPTMAAPETKTSKSVLVEPQEGSTETNKIGPHTKTSVSAVEVDEPTNLLPKPGPSATALPVNDDEPSPTDDATTPDIISIIQQVGQGQPVTNVAEPTSINVGDIVASVIGMVPSQESPAAAPPAITIGGTVVTANSASEFVVGSQTLAPGGAPIVQDGTTFAVAPDATAVVVNGETRPIAAAPQAQQTPVVQITVGGSIFTANSASAFVFGDETLAPGAPAITQDGTTYSIPSSGAAIVINGVTSPIAQLVAQLAAQPTQVAAPQITVGESTINANAASEFVIGSQTLAPGGSAITVSGTILSLAPSGSAIVVNGQTSDIIIPQGSPVTVGAELATPIASGALVFAGGETLSPGSAVTLDGTTYSLATSGTVVINGQTSVLPAVDGTITAVPGPAIDSVTGLVISGTTLLPGSAVVVSGTAYSLPATGSSIYINGEATSLPSVAPGSLVTLPGGVVATPTAGVELVIGSQTLLPGSAITVSGTTYSLSGTDVVVKGSSTTFTAEISELASSAHTSSKTSASSSSRITSSSDEQPSSSTASATSTSEAFKAVTLANGLAIAAVGVTFVMCLL